MSFEQDDLTNNLIEKLGLLMTEEELSIELEAESVEMMPATEREKGEEPEPVPTLASKAVPTKDDALKTGWFGSSLSGYASAKDGPFECHNCIFYDGPDDGKGKCDHPVVQADPTVNGEVEAEGCCSYFWPAGKETQEEEHTEGE